MIGGTGVLYTLPSLAFFFLLLPITGRGKDTAIIALTAYTLQIIFRNTVTGLNNVPAGVKDSGRGMGLTDRQLLWRVELPLAMPEIIAGLRIATVSTVAIATLAVFAGAGGLGVPIYQQIDFKTNIIIGGGIAILMAIVFDVLLLLSSGCADTRGCGRCRVIAEPSSPSRSSTPSATRSTSSSTRSRARTGATEVGGPEVVWTSSWRHIEVSPSPSPSPCSSRCRSGSSSATAAPARCSRWRSATPAGPCRNWH